MLKIKESFLLVLIILSVGFLSCMEDKNDNKKRKFDEILSEDNIKKNKKIKRESIDLVNLIKTSNYLREFRVFSEYWNISTGDKIFYENFYRKIIEIIEDSNTKILEDFIENCLDQEERDLLRQMLNAREKYLVLMEKNNPNSNQMILDFGPHAQKYIFYFNIILDLDLRILDLFALLNLQKPKEFIGFFLSDIRLKASVDKLKLDLKDNIDKIKNLLPLGKDAKFVLENYVDCFINSGVSEKRNKLALMLRIYKEYLRLSNGAMPKTPEESKRLDVLEHFLYYKVKALSKLVQILKIFKPLFEKLN